MNPTSTEETPREVKHNFTADEAAWVEVCNLWIRTLTESRENPRSSKLAAKVDGMRDMLTVMKAFSNPGFINTMNTTLNR